MNKISLRNLILEKRLYDELISICRKKLKEKLPKNKNPKSYGAIIGKDYGDYMKVKEVIPFEKDLRSVEPYKSYVDKLVAKIERCPYCIPEDRGFVVDPKEFERIERKAKEKGFEILAIYHTHYCPLKPDMSTPGPLDKELSNPHYLVMIVDMSKKKKSKIRCFKITKSKKVYEIPIKKYKVELNKSEKNRYKRQLSFLGLSKQISLKDSKVAVIGAGGLGSPVLFYLTCAGIGNLLIIDNDKVSLSDLNRQIMYTERDIGKFKVDVCERRLKELNNKIKITKIKTRLNKKNIENYSSLKEVDVLVDCTDNVKTRALLINFCQKHKIPFIHGAISENAGQQINLSPQKQQKFKFGKEKKRPQVIGALAGIIGSIQAYNVINLLIGKDIFQNQILFDKGKFISLTTKKVVDKGYFMTLKAKKDGKIRSILEDNDLSFDEFFIIKDRRIIFNDEERIKRGESISLFKKVSGG